MTVRFWHHLVCWIVCLSVPFLTGTAIAFKYPNAPSMPSEPEVVTLSALIAAGLKLTPLFSWIALPFGMLIINRELRAGNACALNVTGGGVFVGMVISMTIGIAFLGFSPLTLIPSAVIGALLGAQHALIYWLTLRLLVPTAFHRSAPR